MIESTIPALKQRLRQDMLQRRAAMPVAQRRDHNRAIIGHFMGDIPLQPHDVIGGYWPMSSEIDLTLLWEALLEQGHACALPVIAAQDHPLLFRQWQRGMVLERHAKGVLQPPESAPLLQPNIIVVPLLAFDHQGYRLGFGGGYYDRTLAQLATRANLLAVGVAYSYQRAARLPHEPHDQPLDCVVTERGTVICTPDT